MAYLPFQGFPVLTLQPDSAHGYSTEIRPALIASEPMYHVEPWAFTKGALEL